MDANQGFVKIIALTALVILVAVSLGYFYYSPNRNVVLIPAALPSPISNEAIIQDERSCIKNEVTGQLSSPFLSGKRFSNFCMSGEWGVFNNDGSLSVNWGLDYAGPDDVRLSSGIGRWNLEAGKLEISNTSISDGIYSEFKFFEFDGDIFAIPKKAYCGMFIGPNNQKLKKFHDKYWEERCD